MNSCGAEVLVANLKAQGVNYVFGNQARKSIASMTRSLIRESRPWCAATNRTPRSSRPGWASLRAKREYAWSHRVPVVQTW
jgi:hypothetical protein